ncbi:hypothetical protein OBK23_13815 [Empedobacter falsenii]|uniref:hypothetical protein n=1 Tax=Empedobacter TaxID=59734 RepID=UPI0025B9592C|nr:MULTISPECIES: hypothetical protein [unclassified Empedobacter]
MFKENSKLKEYAYILLILTIIGFVITVVCFYIKTGLSCVINPDILDKFGSFVGGLFGSLLTFITTLLLIYSNNNQQKEIDRINRKDDVDDAYNRLLKLIDLYRQHSKILVLKEGKYTDATYKSEFKGYLGKFEARYYYYQLRKIDKESYNNDILDKLNDEITLQIVQEMCKKILFIFKLVDSNDYLDKVEIYDLLKFTFLKEEFKILYFICLLNLVEKKFSWDLENEKFVHNFYKKIQLQEFLEDDFLNSLMMDRFLIN